VSWEGGPGDRIIEARSEPAPVAGPSSMLGQSFVHTDAALPLSEIETFAEATILKVREVTDETCETDSDVFRIL
jgi:hypothetical protein